MDDGPLKRGAFGDSRTEHRREDAIRLRPAAGEVLDGLLCDLVEEPRRVARRAVAPWLAGGWCRRLVLDLAFGRADPLALLCELRARGSRFARHAAGLRARHLVHDREALSAIGEQA